MKTFLLLLLTVITSLSFAQSPHTIDADCLRIQDGVCIDKLELGYLDGLDGNLQTKIAGKVDDTAYNATSWDGVTSVAPSKNAVRDQIEAMLAIVAGNVSDTAYNATSWDGVTTVAPSKNSVRDQVETMLSSIALKAPLASPALTGTPTVPTAAVDTNTTQAASTAYVKAQIAADTTVVHTTGNESVAGTKTYTGKTVASSTANGFHPCPTMTQAQRDLIASPADGDCVYNSTTNKVNTYNSATSLWEAVGTGSGSGGGGTDYITNDDAETNTSGWSCYSDGASATPVDGTGGSPTTAIAVSASSPLKGAQSFVITKSTTQGEGCSYAFTIDAAYKAKMLRISFPYETTSLVDGSFRVYIYDVTNNRLIDVDNRDITANTFGQFIGSFQTSSDSVSYRLILHGADTTSGSLKFDEGSPVTLGPQTLVKGPVITDWKDYTATYTGFGTPTVTYSKWRRSGDTLQIMHKFSCGTSTATTASVSLPSGSVINFGSAGQALLGHYTRGGSGGFAFSDAKGGSIHGVHGSSVVNFSRYDQFGSSTINVDTLSPGNTVCDATTNTIGFTVSMPVSGWSSSNTLSEDGGVRLIAAQGSLASAQTAVPDKVIPFDTKIEDTVSMCNFTTGVCTIPETGDYDITSAAQLTSLDGATDATINIRKNSSVLHTNFCYRLASGTASNIACDISKTVAFTKGDTFDIYVDGDASFDIVNNSSRTTFSIAKRSSPQTLAGGETVAVSAAQSAGTSLPNSGSTDISWDATLNYTTHASAISGTTFTAPASGKYRSCVRLKFTSGAWASGNSYAMNLKKNGSIYKYYVDTQLPAGATFELNLSGPCVDVPLSKGDTLTVNVSHNRTAGALALAASTTQNYWDIVRVGN